MKPSEVGPVTVTFRDTALTPLVGIPATPVTWIFKTSSAPILVLVTVRRP